MIGKKGVGKWWKKNFHIVEVTWEDAQSSTTSELPEHLQDFKLLQTKSVGYLICKDEFKIVLGFIVFDSSDEERL